MQMYRVKLAAEHMATAKQVKGGYLAENGEYCIYSAVEAIKKSSAFNGAPEKFGKAYTITRIRMLQLDSRSLCSEAMKSLKAKAAYKNRDEDMFICYGNVFEDILDQVQKQKKILPEEVIVELKVLAKYCTNADYVQLL